MVATPITGVEAVDRELRRRKFTDAETAEAVANQLLAVWKAMQPGSNNAYLMLGRQRHRQAHKR
jgi:hypothetical protein